MTRAATEIQAPESPRPDDGLDHPDHLAPVSGQLMGHHTYEFLDDGRRVGFDRRDGSVTVYAGGAWQDPFPAGFARPCASGGWALHDGHTNQLLGWASSRKQAARRIAEHAQPQLAKRADRRAAHAAAAHALDEQIVALIRRAIPGFEPPAPAPVRLGGRELLDVLEAVAVAGQAALDESAPELALHSS